MFTFCFSAMGRFLAILPEGVVQFLCRRLGGLFFHVSLRRRRILLSNLRHVYPHLDEMERRRIGRRSADRLMEMGLFSLALPYFSKERLRRHFTAEGPWGSIVHSIDPQILLIPHQTLTEALTILPFFWDVPPEWSHVHILYRPFRSKGLEQFIRRTRERFGTRLLPRKSGLFHSIRILRGGGCVGLLFDQSAGASGVQTLLCGRVAATTALPQFLLKNAPAEVFIATVKRTDFWRATLSVEKMPCTAQNILEQMNGWLEEKLRDDVNFRDNWLWAHNRWKRPQKQWFSLHSRKNNLADQEHRTEKATLPRETKLFIRLPTHLADTVAVLPIVRSIRLGRADLHITLLCQLEHAEWLASLGLADTVRPLPEHKFFYFLRFLHLRYGEPDMHLIFPSTFCAAWEAFLLRSPIRIGLSRWQCPLRSLLLTHRLRNSRQEKLSDAMRWQRALEPFGLPSELSLEPLRTLPNPSQGRSIAIFLSAQSECKNYYPPEEWNVLTRTLLERYQRRKVLLFGTCAARKFSLDACRNLPQNRVENFVGLTSTMRLSQLLEDCAVAVGLNCSGLHMANALGIPTISLICNAEDENACRPIFSTLKFFVCAENGKGGKTDAILHAVESAIGS
ncbi:MAG: hypothetical protein LBC42_03580 [Puniceicoccales bacterium]|nr:hypothetical protein [Puniceicoccales bacterium]